MNLQKKLANLLATTKRKRPYYCEVEYLESTGTQCIDTGVVFSNSSHTYKWDIGAQAVNTSDSNYNWFCGFFEGGANSAGTYADTTTNYNFYAVGTYYQNGQAITAPLTSGDKYGIIRNVFTITNFAGTLPIILFGRNQSNGVKCEATKKIFYFKIYDNDTLIRDFIPVLDWDMKPCMYDKVSGELFYNKGTSDFVAGRQIHRVEYLESTGTQYIDTGVIGKDGITAETRIQRTTTSSNECFVGAFNLVNRLWLAYTFGGNWYRGYNAASGGWTPSTPITDWYTIKSSIPSTGTVVFDCNGISKSDSYTTGFTTGVNVQLFQMGNTNESHYPARGKMSYCKLYDYGVLVRDYIPAIDENGVGYMFDRVTHTIYDNAGQGAFSYPPVELEYLESTGALYIDTGIHPTDEYGYRIKNTYTRGGGEQCAVGCMEGNNRFVGIYTSGSANQLSGAWGSFVNFLPSYHWDTGDILDVEVNYKNSRKMIVNGTELKDISDIHISGTINNTLYLFARNYGSKVTKMHGRIYEAEITKGSDIVAHFIPCYKDGQAGMWDKVNKTFYENKGTGNFIAGLIREK